MSDDNITPHDFLEFDPHGDSTILRFPLAADRAEQMLREYVSTDTIPNIDMLDEIHILVSPAAIKKAYDEIPRPDLELESFVSPLLSDPVFVSMATSLMGLKRLFTGLSAVLLDKGIVEPSDLTNVVADLTSELEKDTEPSAELLRVGIRETFSDYVEWVDEYTGED